MIILKDVQKMQGACVIGINGTNDFTGILMFRIKKLKLVCDEPLITEIMSYRIYMAYFDL
jgi:hypothetical protein